MKNYTLSRFCTGAFLIFAFHTVHAVTITYEVQHISGNAWEYTYSATNDLPQTREIALINILFETGLYENLSVTSVPADWKSIAHSPIAPSDGIYRAEKVDRLAVDTGIAPGDTLGGFGIRFDFLGVGTPGSQTFTVAAPNRAVFASGETQATVVPVPATVWLFGSGLLGLVGFARGKQRNS